MHRRRRGERFGGRGSDGRGGCRGRSTRGSAPAVRAGIATLGSLREHLCREPYDDHHREHLRSGTTLANRRSASPAPGWAPSK